MKKLLLVIGLCLLPAIANAGFVGSFIGGAVGASSGSKGAPPPGSVVASNVPGHTVIVCMPTTSVRLTVCESDFGTGYKDLSPKGYAQAAGYSVVYNTGILVVGDRIYIIMEVGN